MIHIAFGFDENYAMPCGVAITSICETTPSPVFFHALIAEDVTEDSRKKIEAEVNAHGNSVAFYVIDQERLSTLSEFKYFTRSVYNRFLIPELLPTDVHKVLYLDSDVIAIKSLQELWDTPLEEDVPIAMAYDSGCTNVVFHNSTGIPITEPYYNSGVILMNLDCWRREGLAQICIKSMEENNFLLVDQDVLNVVLGKRLKNLHLRYNCQICLLIKSEESWLLDKERYFSQVYEAIADPVIIHYTEGLKPWHSGCRFAAEWLKFKSLSPWKDIQLVTRTVKGEYQLFVSGVDRIDISAADSIAVPMVALASELNLKHPRIFSLLRKAAWTIAKKKRLVKDQ